MQYTTNCNLKKPEGSDPVNIQDINDNTDSIDTELGKRVSATGGDISNTKIATAESIATEFPVPAAGDAPKTFLGKMKKFTEDFRNLRTGLLTVGMLVNNCVTDNPNLPLSAKQGKVLMDLLNQLNGELFSAAKGNITFGMNGIYIGEFANGVKNRACMYLLASDGGNTAIYAFSITSYSSGYLFFNRLHQSGFDFVEWQKLF